MAAKVLNTLVGRIVYTFVVAFATGFAWATGLGIVMWVELWARQEPSVRFVLRLVGYLHWYVAQLFGAASSTPIGPAW